MTRLLLIAFFLSWPILGLAGTVVAVRTVGGQTILTAADLRIDDIDVAGAATSIEDVVGLESKLAVYAGRPIMLSQLGTPAIIERNQIVPLSYRSHGLTIVTDGRALGRAAFGAKLRVMNLSSRTTVFGRVEIDGTVVVSP